MYGARVKPSLLALALVLSCEQDYTVVPQAPAVDPADVTECGFTRVEDTSFFRYDCNPVFPSRGEDGKPSGVEFLEDGEPWADVLGSTIFNVTEVLGHPFYQLWYTGLVDDGTDSSFPPYAMGYAISPDGVDFASFGDNPVLGQGGDSSFDADYMSGNQVVWDPGSEQYVMIWQGINDDRDPTKIVNGLGVATSSDGRDWTRFAKNPVFDFGQVENRNVNYCWPLDLTLGEVSGYTGYMAGNNSGSQICEVYRLNAGALGDWKASDEPVLESGEPGEWDDKGMIALSSAKLGDERHMFYVGFGDWTESGNYILATNAFLGMATYDFDDDQWEKAGDPIPLNLTDEGSVSGVEALVVGTRIHLWITDDYSEETDGDFDQAIGYFLFDPERAALEDEGGE